MKSYIWDTGGLILYFSDKLMCKDLMNECLLNNIGSVSQIVLLELYYMQWREFGKRIVKHRTEGIMESGLEILQLSQETLFTAGEYKIKFPILSLVDSILTAFAKMKGSTVITTEIPLTGINGVKTIKLEW